MLDPVRIPSIFLRHRALRWLAPVGVLGVVGLAASGMITATASTSDPLPGTTAAELLAAVQSSPVSGFSGTIVAQMSLGLPQLPALSAEASGSSMAALLAGSHTMRLWYGGPDRQRVALLNPTSETDVFHSGQDVWQWDSDTHVATHTVLPRRPDGSRSDASGPPATPTSVESLTPQQLAARALAAIDPTTKVALGANRTVADRSAYELVLTPRTSATRIGSITISIDGATKIPLGVQVYARGSSAAAIDVAFSDVSFKKPPSGYFQFTPPPGATVHTGTKPAVTAPGTVAGDHVGTSDRVTTLGTGWSSVLEYHATGAEVTRAAGSSLTMLTPVSGAWGRGRLLDAALFSVLVTNDGRVFAGSVDPAALYAAALVH